MRTTLTIDDDVLAVAKERARAEHTTVGAVISEATRRDFTKPSDSDTERFGVSRLGFPVMRSRGAIITNEIIDAIREEEGI